MNSFQHSLTGNPKELRPSIALLLDRKHLPGDSDRTGASSAGINCRSIVHRSIANAGTTGVDGNPACVAGCEPTAPAGRDHVDGPASRAGRLETLARSRDRVRTFNASSVLHDG